MKYCGSSTHPFSFCPTLTLSLISLSTHPLLPLRQPYVKSAYNSICSVHRCTVSSANNVTEYAFPQRKVRRALWDASGDNGDFGDHIS